jgi:hypothetical protein
MEKEFVPYEFALKLKTLGFDKPCFGWYQSGRLKKEYHPLKENSGNQSYMLEDDCTAPTFSQAFRWFREKYKLHTEIRSYTAKYFTIIIQECKDIVRYIEYGGIYLKFKTYEEAEISCLNKLIEIVEINK